MKIGIITFVKCDNYGAELQAFALQKQLSIMGYDAEVVDLEKETGMLESSKRTIINAFVNRIRYYGWFKGFSRFIQLVIDKQKARIAAKKNKDNAQKKHDIFNRFFYEYIKHSCKFYKLDEINNVNLPYDVFIAGSDQIWNYMQTRHLDVFFLMFANKLGAKKLSYAASFSVKSIPEDLKPTYKSYLENLDAISVRENNAVDLVRDCSGKNAIQVLDPTLLLNRDQWIEYVGNKDYVQHGKRYVVIYTLSGSKYIYCLAKKIAKRLDAEVVNIKSGYSRVKGDEEITQIMDAGPREFISLFEHAVYVITDSFHGTAFSINFNIPFTTLLNPVSNINSRALSILEMTGLKDSRLIYDDGENREPVSLDVDFTAANRIIDEKRKLSLRFLRDNL